VHYAACCGRADSKHARDGQQPENSFQPLVSFHMLMLSRLLAILNGKQHALFTDFNFYHAAAIRSDWRIWHEHRRDGDVVSGCDSVSSPTTSHIVLVWQESFPSVLMHFPVPTTSVLLRCMIHAYSNHSSAINPTAVSAFSYCIARAISISDEVKCEQRLIESCIAYEYTVSGHSSCFVSTSSSHPGLDAMIAGDPIDMLNVHRGVPLSSTELWWLGDAKSLASHWTLPAKSSLNVHYLTRVLPQMSSWRPYSVSDHRLVARPAECHPFHVPAKHGNLWSLDSV
jgi:hypothetical protein